MDSGYRKGNLTLTLSPLRHKISPNIQPKTLTRTSTLQSDFQRAEPLVEYEGIETNAVQARQKRRSRMDLRVVKRKILETR